MATCRFHLQIYYYFTTSYNLTGIKQIHHRQISENYLNTVNNI